MGAFSMAHASCNTVAMRRVWLAALCVALIGCSASPEPKKAEVKNEDAPDVFTVNLDTSKGMVAIEAHRDWAPRGSGPDPARIQAQGNAYLEANFPRLDYIRKMTIQ